MKYSLSNLSYIEFSNRLNEFIDKIQIVNEKKQFEDIVQKVNDFLDKNINPDPEPFKDLLIYSDLLDFGIFRKNEHEKFKNNKKKFLENIVRLNSYFSISETFLGNEIKVESVPEKSDFILQKLNDLYYSEDYYSIKVIFLLNDIHFRSDENLEIASDLKRRGYVILENEYGNDDKVRISVKGANYIERKLITQNTKKNKEKSTEIDKKIDLILKHLTKLGYGQQIIFEEIEEIRDLQSKLPKKSWGQLLKGKLFDLALDEIISKEVAAEVFEFLTNTSMKFLK